MKKTNKSTVAAAATGIAALGAAAAAGMYFFGGKSGAKNRQKVTRWGEKAKKQILEELKAMEKVSKSNYDLVVDAVTKQYKDLKNVDPKELQEFAKEIKGHWDSISKEVGGVAKKITNLKSKPTAKASPKKKPITKKIAKKPVTKKAKR